jgi:hypothetical protein
MSEHGPTTPAPAAPPKLWGILVEFEDIHGFMVAAARVRDAGYKRWDTHTPFPVHGLNDAMGLKLTKLPLLTLAGGLTGLTGFMFIQWWMNAVDYPIIISGKPMWSIPANIPVAFEGTILLAAICTFLGMLALNNLPMHYHPLLNVKRFKGATTDRFYISIEAADARFDEAETLAFAESLGGDAVERVEE